MKAESARDLAKLAPVPRDFYGRDVVTVSRDLLGKVLVRQEGRRIRAGRIVEVEGYLGIGDPAAHSAAGKTARNFVLFGPPGRAYIYFIYGNHYCLNVSCEPDGTAGGILIRALEPLAGIELMAAARGIEGDLERLSVRRSLTSGPGETGRGVRYHSPARQRQRRDGGEVGFANCGRWISSGEDCGHAENRNHQGS